MPQLRESGNDGASQGLQEDLEQDGFARIFGIETEYGVSVTGADKPCDAATVAMAMFRPVVTRSRSTNTYLPNGARLYLDVGSHPEYATAEARDPHTALAQDLAGERMMRQLALDAQQRLRPTYGEGATVHLFKNNVDSAGHSFGCHENYLVRRFVSLRDVERELLPFLITRQVFSGAGRLSGRGLVISQRADYLDESISSATTRARPMVNTRDEPHADPERYRRLHVIIGDSNRSQYAGLMKLATTHLVLCVIEQAARLGVESGFECCALQDPSSANRAISRDVHCGGTPLKLTDPEGFARARAEYGATDLVAAGGSGKNGGSATIDALGMQRYYAAVVARFLERYGAQVHETMPRLDIDMVMHEWIRLLNCLAAGEFAALDNQVDWIAKQALFEALRRRHPAAAEARFAQLDLDYHDVANGAVYDSLVHHGAMRTIISADEVREAMTRPPQDTRAALRGAFVAKALQRDVRFSCDWTRLTLGTSGQDAERAEAVMLDPFETQASEDYRRLMQQLEA
ncbi:MAG: proteasome accessory factor PafA2 family protein [Bifidobacterium tibiigranuli]|jgi:proteasome accessory factor A|uniref:proteasome accessory factor PafA2 family protein n=1 Tax=Bifidobacterium tibiigranuli TaxID=2172043 RepID=UPI0026E9797F|nr:proteasome accessory factor PafA2 family protein [Bifidobacterium tibiigranuli]MCI1673382.1 proteasome accessory factor PafA2 family protein [Bifidobacterium tibiigranuli]MCI1712506.1 proteasome accessory factor PafA2 family protein [Bifidobacterium tibiigranuli]MCI1834024.1 proteasome accessory factor PafA2 family protein [Bifidobacterium tibiigranuli]